MRLLHKFGTSIRKQLVILLLLIGLLPTIIMGTVAYIIIRSELRTSTQNQLQSTAIKQEQRLNALLQNRQEQVIRLANQFDFQVALGKYFEDPNENHQQAIDTILQSRIVTSSNIQAIQVSNLDATVIASTTDNEGQKLESKEFTIPDSQQVNATVRPDPLDNIEKLYITTRTSVNNQEVAYLTFVFRINDILATVQDYTGLGETGETIIAAPDENGNPTSLFPLRFDNEAALNVNLRSLELFTKSDNTYYESTDYRDKKVIVAPRTIGFTNWIMATKIDSSEAFQSINQLRNTLIAVLSIFSIIIIIVALFITRYFTRPILRMTTIAKQIGAGDFSARINLARNDELGTLSKSIDSMGSSLNDFVAHIESERNRLSIILDSTTEGILAISKQGTILIANDAAIKLAHKEREQIIGQHIETIFDWARGEEKIRLNYDIPEPNIYPDLEFTDAAGNKHFIKLVVAKVKDTGKQLTAQTIVTIHDETKSRELENMKLDFVSMAAHELRTPLASLRGYLELIAYKLGNQLRPDIDHSIKKALRSTTDLSGLINNLLDVTRIEHGTLTFTLEKIDLISEIITPSINDIRFSAEDKNITLLYQEPKDKYFIFADKIALREVVNNLLANAIKYTPSGGKIEVTLQKEGQTYIVKVKDNGVGIPKRALPNLFTKFYRVHGGLESGSQGTGLGLFISKSIIERHNGTISVESEEGTGSTFSFTLPVFSEVRQNNTDKDETRGHRGWTTKNITR